MVRLAPTPRVVASAGSAAGGAADEAPHQVPAIVLPIGIPVVLFENGDRPLLEARFDHGRHRLLDDVLAAVRLDSVDARVRGLADDVGDRHDGPELGAWALLAVAVAPSRGWEAEVVETLGVRVEGGAFGDVLDDLAHDLHLFRHDLEEAALVGAVAVGGRPEVFAAPVRPVQARPRPLPDGLALVLCEAGEHLEDEPAAGVGGVYGLGGTLQGHTAGLKPIVGVDGDQEGPAEPIQAVDEERGELALLGVLRRLSLRPKFGKH
jgi:hypothetical protein